MLLKTGINDRSSCETNLAIICSSNLGSNKQFFREWRQHMKHLVRVLGRFVSGSNRQDYYALILNASNSITEKNENRLIHRRHFVSGHHNIHSFRTTVGNIAARQ